MEIGSEDLSAGIRADDNVAPIELMTQFLIFISEGNMVHALQLASEILIHEPNNLMILEYKESLTVLIRQLEGSEIHYIINHHFS